MVWRSSRALLALLLEARMRRGARAMRVEQAEQAPAAKV